MQTPLLLLQNQLQNYIALINLKNLKDLLFRLGGKKSAAHENLHAVD